MEVSEQANKTFDYDVKYHTGKGAVSTVYREYIPLHEHLLIETKYVRSLVTKLSGFL